MVSEQGAATEALAVWKVGACHAVVAVVTVLGSKSILVCVQVIRVCLLYVGV